jgi:CheY-like chemotaxis protein
VPSAKIFIVEDNPSDIFLLRRCLLDHESEFELEIARDGEAALEFVARQRAVRHNPQPCVALLDLHLPKYDGFDVLRALCQSPPLSHVRVVVTSTSASPHEQAEIRKMGADFRLKPRELSEFCELAAYLIAICRASFRATTMAG